jgi:hypothetical protein
LSRFTLKNLLAVLLVGFALSACVTQPREQKDFGMVSKVFPYPLYAVVPVVNDVVRDLGLNFEMTRSEGRGIRAIFGGSADAPGRGEAGSVVVQPMNNRQTEVIVVAGARGKSQRGTEPDPVLAEAIFKAIDAAVRASVVAESKAKADEAKRLDQ